MTYTAKAFVPMAMTIALPLISINRYMVIVLEKDDFFTAHRVALMCIVTSISSIGGFLLELTAIPFDFIGAPYQLIKVPFFIRAFAFHY